MMSPNYRIQHAAGEGITDGIDISTWKIQRASETPVVFSVWDFAGQTLYYNTHQFFLTGRAVYFLVWNIRMGHEHAGLHFWLNSISCHAPKAPIFIVGTHCDQVSASELPVDDLKKRYPQIAGFANISSMSGQVRPRSATPFQVVASCFFLFSAGREAACRRHDAGDA